MDAGTKVTPGRLAAQAPGDVVTIESGLAFSLRTGWRAGRGDYRALVTAPSPRAGMDDRRREQQRLHVLRRTWSRNHGDVEALRELHEAIGERLRELESVT